MKFIHLSDLHLGKRVFDYNLSEDQEYILQEIDEFYEQLNGRPMSDEQQDFAREIMESYVRENWEHPVYRYGYLQTNNLI